MNELSKLSININDLNEMKLFAQFLATTLDKTRGVIFLDGDLGAGKTTFTQFFAKELGIKENVTSPTFTIFKRYEFNDSALNHFDLYRIKEEVYDNGFEDYWFDSNEFSIIEWSTYLPQEFQNIFLLKIYINLIDENGRILSIEGSKPIIEKLKEFK